MKFLIVQDNTVKNIILASNQTEAEILTNATAFNLENHRYSNIDVGWIYDPEHQKFRNPNPPYDSWSFDFETWQYIAPVPYPKDNFLYKWDENKLNWKLVVTDDNQKYKWSEKNLNWELVETEEN